MGSTFIGAIISGLITWFVYVKGAKELSKQAGELKDLNILMLRAMENAGLAKLNKNENGSPIGLTNIDLSGLAFTGERASASLDETKD